MFNNINHQRNANQIYKEIFSHLLDGYHQENEMSVARHVEKREYLYTVGRIVNWFSHYGKHYGGSS